MIAKFIKNNWIHFAAIVAFFLMTFIHFHPRIQGKKVQSGDYTSVVAMQQEVVKHREETGEISYWTNGMFSGMPTYYIKFPRSMDLIDVVREITHLGSLSEFGYSFYGMISFYILMLILGINPILGIIGAIAFAFSTNNIILLDTGHMSKLGTVLTSPLIIGGVILAYRQKFILGFLVFATAMAINLKSDHPQMTYYLALTLLPYIIFVFIDHFKKKEILGFVKSSGILVVALLIAVGCSSSKLLPTYEYSKDTMRGKPILQNNSSNFSSSNVEGLSWNYAMMWSNGMEDLLSSFIPLAVGGSSSEMVSSDSQFAKELRKRGVNTRQGVQAPTYWGSLPFTSGPSYFGAVIFLFFFMGLFSIKGNLKWWILSGFILTALLSMGKNFEVFNRLFFDYFPMYNKFRTPNSILSVTVIIVPILALLGFQHILENKDSNIKKLLIPGVGLAAFCLLVGMIGPGFSDMSAASDARYEQMGLSASILKADRATLMSASAYRSAILMFISLALVWAFLKKKLNMNLLILGVGLLAIGDLVSTNFRYFKPSDYITERAANNSFQARPVDQQILQDKDPHYRVFDLSIATFESALSSYHHKTIGGYHAAKLQRYQDMIDYHISKNNRNVLNMLNAKYIISQGADNQPQAQRNRAALGNAWFVNNFRIVNTPDEEIEALTNFDPLAEAVVHNEFSNQLDGKAFQKSGTINLTSYSPGAITYNTDSDSEQLTVFSEVWYGPGKGWNAYIDGNPVDHFRANYILRALVVPAGNHEIRFAFEPQAVAKGKMISLISSIIIFGVFAFYMFSLFKKKTKDSKA